MFDPAAGLAASANAHQQESSGMKSSTKSLTLESFKRRKRERIDIWLDEPEPQSKKMREADRKLFQQNVLRAMEDMQQTPPVGDIALRIDLSTSAKNPPQAHTIAKNYLDLLARPLPGVADDLGSILYDDDRRVRALCVTCMHGLGGPPTRIEARTMESMREDLETATAASQALDESPNNYMQSEYDDDSIARFKEVLAGDDPLLSEFNGEDREAYIAMHQWSAQKVMLRRSKAAPQHLWWLYAPSEDLLGIWTKLISKQALRLQMGELPVVAGSSAAFKQNIGNAIAAFKTRWDWLINPLRIPVGLQLIVKPAHNTPENALHDLDNIVRNYLIAPIVTAFDTVTNDRFTFDMERLKRLDPSLHAIFSQGPPKGTRNGVTHYEAWRLDPAKLGESGFVSVALVPGAGHDSDVFEEIDERVKRWSDLDD
jgi:hypothetical protein